MYEPGRAVGCSIVGSTGMHMRWLESADRVELAPEPTGYIMAFPVPGSVAQMQSNMAATLNIDWIVDCAREAAAVLGHEVERKAALGALDGRVLEGRAAASLFHPYIHEAGERGPFVDVAARAMFTGLSTRTGFVDLVRSVYEGLALAARDCYLAMGALPDEVRIAGGAARSRAFKTILASVLDVPIRETTREESGAAGCGDDGRGGDRRGSPTWPQPWRPGSRRRWATASRPTRRWPRPTPSCFRSISRPARRCRRSGAGWRRAAREGWRDAADRDHR